MKGKLQLRTQTYSRGKPHERKQCGKSFTPAGTLRKHERIHTGKNHMNANSVESISPKQNI